MTVQEDSMMNELKSRIKLLENQNAQSLGYMEDKLLLWLGAESIQQADTIADLIYNLLDRVAVLLDLPYGACYEISNKNIKLVQQFQPNISSKANDPLLRLTPGLIDKLYSDPLIIPDSSPLFDAVELISMDKDSIHEISFYPFQSISIPFGIFVFISSDKTPFSFDAVNGALHYLVNIAVEKIEKLSLRDELKELNRVFESKLKVRTTELEESLKAKQKEIEELKVKIDLASAHAVTKKPKSDESLDYLKNVGVEVRTPLNGILGFSELLRDISHSGVDKESYIDIIKSCGKSILKIVDDAIELSRLEQEDVQVVSEEIELADFMSELYDHYKKDELFQQRKDVELKLNIKVAATTRIKTDIGFLSQILSNLIGNAIKFTNRGTIEIGVQLIEQADVELPLGIRFFVRDTGVGISEEVWNKIFDRFYKVEHEIAKLYGGLGLGLTIAKILVKKLGGTIGFESKSGKGSEFFFNLPSSLIVEGSLGVKGMNGFEQTYAWQGKRILIVEDDKMSLIYLQEVLKSTGAELVYVADGKTAIDMVKNDQTFDLILMDIKLPGISGYEATEIIRRFSDIPIIAQTAYAMADDYKRMIQVGCDDYISKPINRRKLLTKIDSIFNYHNK